MMFLVHGRKTIFVASCADANLTMCSSRRWLSAKLVRIKRSSADIRAKPSSEIHQRTVTRKEYHFYPKPCLKSSFLKIRGGGGGEGGEDRPSTTRKHAKQQLTSTVVPHGNVGWRGGGGLRDKAGATTTPQNTRLRRTRHLYHFHRNMTQQEGLFDPPK